MNHQYSKLSFLRIFLFIFTTLFILQVSEGLKGYKIRQFKILCYNIDKTKTQFERCEIKAKRGRYGLLNVIVHYQNLTEAQFHLQMFYRGTSGRYQPFLVNVHLDPCNRDQNIAGKEIKKRVVKIFERFDPNLTKGCPLSGTMNITNFDFDKESEKFYPPVIAGGVFMIYMHLTDNHNHTYVEVKYFIEAKPIGLTDVITLG